MTYNRASMRLSELRHDEVGLRDSYSYDSLYRIARSDFDQSGGAGSVPRDLQAQVCELDGVGSRRSVVATSATTGSSTTSLLVNAMNEYVTVGGVPWSYSDNGNLLGDGVRRFAYDDETISGRLRAPR